MCGERNDTNHFWWERWCGKLGKQIGDGGQRQSRRRSEVGCGDGCGGEAGGATQRIESVDNFRAHIIIQL